MYAPYIMERTQIYLTDQQASALDRRARASGRTRSDLIREAIDRVYLSAQAEREETLRTLQETFGAWKGRRPGGKAYVERLRARGARRLRRLLAR